MILTLKAVRNRDKFDATDSLCSFYSFSFFPFFFLPENWNDCNLIFISQYNYLIGKSYIVAYILGYMHGWIITF
jgi:hypothetical protein